MQLPSDNVLIEDDFRSKVTRQIAVASLLLLAPFSIMNLMQQKLLPGIVPIAAVLMAIALTSRFRLRVVRPAVGVLIMTAAMVAALSFSLHTQGVTAIFWCFPILLAYYCIFEEGNALLANAITLISIIPQAWYLLDVELATRAVATLLAVSVFLVISSRVTNAYHESLKTQAITDPLTGLFNRSVLGITLDRSVEQGRRVNIPMTVLLIDLDHFKKINDQFGHHSGDTVLARVGPLIRDRTRMSDTCFRIGGEEFLCLLYGSDLKNALRVAENIREQIETSAILPGHTVTASIGVACLNEDEDSEQWRARADEALYRAKHRGRNRVCGG